MPTRPDLRDITTGVKDALADCDRDTLLDILTFVVKEYVVDGPPPMLIHQTETIADLERLSFAQLIATLQTRLELAELGLFTVDGDQVSVRIGGVMQPLARAGVAAPAAELPRPSAGVRVVETGPRPAPSAAPVAPMPVSSTVTERAARRGARPVAARSASGDRRYWWWRWRWRWWWRCRCPGPGPGAQPGSRAADPTARGRSARAARRRPR
ncbi:MAG: hypothetical protein R3B06_17090 [Kofleriaceae bacterium]